MRVFLTAVAMLVFASTTFSMTSTMTPPDSTQTIIEKGTTKYLISEGKRLYNESEYRKALAKFREALAKDNNNAMATYWVGECHLVLKNYETALKYGEQALAMDSTVSDEIHYLIGYCNHRLENLDVAIENFEKAKTDLTEAKLKSLRVSDYINECKLAQEMMNAPVKLPISALNMYINSINDEYAAVIADGGKTLYFSSRRADNDGGGISPGDRKFFSDIYVAYWNDATKDWGMPSNDNDTIKRLNSVGFDAVGSVSSDGEYIYISINTDGLDKPKPKTRSTDIFYSKISTKGTWGTPKPMPKKTINTLFFEASPSFTADGNTMYFASERIGGKGMADIYVSRKVSRTEWSKPENLGNVINTPYQETTVFVTPDEKYLFFSSTGHKGMGGYDIYYSVNQDGIWSDPINMGYPINSVNDETHFQYYPALKKAIYSQYVAKENLAGNRELMEVNMTDFQFQDPE